ncbi:MAG: hypothetical protein WCC25_04245 [Candidatus Korobacteraceae bacterium]
MRQGKRHRIELSGDDGGLRPAHPPFSFVRYWGKILLGVVLLSGSFLTLLAFSSRLKTQHGGAADFLRLIAIGMSGAVALLGILFIRWAFAERSRSK